MENIVSKEIKKNPKISILTGFLLLTLLIALIAALKQQNWVSITMVIVIAILICLPRIVGKLSKITIPLSLEVFCIIFIYATLFLGELKNYYAKFWWWDTLLHTSSGIAFGIIGFITLYILYKTEKIKTSPKTIAMFSFAFSLAIGALWEIVEFTIDSTFGPISNGVTMQGTLTDTMGDLIVDSLGALSSAIMGYLFIKLELKKIATPIVKDFKDDNPRLFKKKKKISERPNRK